MFLIKASNYDFGIRLKNSIILNINIIGYSYKK